MKMVNNNQNNYFVRLYNEYGEDFLNCPKICISDIQNNTIKILKDIFKNNLDLSIFGRYILDPNVLESMKDVIQKKVNYYAYLCECLEFTRLYKYNSISDIVPAMIESEVLSKFKTFNMILQTLNSISVTKNITELNILSQQLNAEKLVYNL